MVYQFTNMTSLSSSFLILGLIETPDGYHQIVLPSHQRSSCTSLFDDILSSFLESQQNSLYVHKFSRPKFNSIIINFLHEISCHYSKKKEKVMKTINLKMSPRLDFIYLFILTYTVDILSTVQLLKQFHAVNRSSLYFVTY